MASGTPTTSVPEGMPPLATTAPALSEARTAASTPTTAPDDEPEPEPAEPASDTAAFAPGSSQLLAEAEAALATAEELYAAGNFSFAASKILMAVADFELCKAAEQQEVAIQLRDTISEALCRSSCEAMPCWMLTSTHGPGPTPADASWRHRRASMERDVLGLKDDVATPSSWECTAKLRIQLADETAPTEDEGAGHGFELVWWKKQQGRQPCTVRVKGDGAVEIVLLPRDFGGELAECKGDHDDDGRKQTDTRTTQLWPRHTCSFRRTRFCTDHGCIIEPTGGGVPHHVELSHTEHPSVLHLPEWERSHGIQTELCSSLGRSVDPVRVGVSLSFLRRFLLAHPEIEEKGLSTAEVCYQIIVPSTAQSQLTYAETYHEAVGSSPSSCFVSHAWSYPFAVLVNTIARYEARESPGIGRENVGGSYWIDIFCKNQWVVNSTSTERELAAAVGSAHNQNGGCDGEGASSVLFVVHPWPEPAALRRIWCLFEVFTAICVGALVDVELSEAAHAAFTDQLSAGTCQPPPTHFIVPWEPSPAYGTGTLVSGLDIRNAEATVQSDIAMIMSQIERLPAALPTALDEEGNRVPTMPSFGGVHLAGVARVNAVVKFELERGLFGTRWLRSEESSCWEWERGSDDAEAFDDFDPSDFA